MSMKSPEEFAEFQEELANAESLSEKAKDELMEMELQGGVEVNDLKPGDQIDIRTATRTYRLEVREDGTYISGHPKYCPEPTLVKVAGASGGAGGIVRGRIVRGVGMELLFGETRVNTTPVQEITEVK